MCPSITVQTSGKQEFNIRPGPSPFTEKPCRKDLGIVENKAVARPQIIQNIRKDPVFNGTGLFV